VHPSGAPPQLYVAENDKDSSSSSCSSGDASSS